MAIPDYHTLMLPVLKVLGDGRERRFNELLPTLADKFQLTEEERAQLLPSGRQQMFRNRVHWASFYLLKAGLLAQTRTPPNRRARRRRPEARNARQ
jgi:restriction system protein